MSDLYDSQNHAPTLPRICNDALRRARFRGCLLAGAAGDALGGAVEFSSLSEIRQNHGANGISNYVQSFGSMGAITDDTQMTLYTAEGLLRGYVRTQTRGLGTSLVAVTAHAYLRWLLTQGIRSPLLRDDAIDGWLSTHRALYSRRAPGSTCLSALSLMSSFGNKAENDSKGCGGVMRAAPVGLFMSSKLLENKSYYIAETFKLGCDVAAITHGHPTGQLPSGTLALLVGLLVNGESLDNALNIALRELQQHDKHQESLDAIVLARSLSSSDISAEAAIQKIGEGWIAEEALAIAVFSCLRANDLQEGVIMAVNHGGDSDSTGAIAGNILGAMFCEEEIPQRWLNELELRDVIGQVADDLAVFHEWRLDWQDNQEESTFYWTRYPGW
ncbi:ADP-ribosylglycohydrolase family protein [Noviherbaspirillum galbum]|uniref:ADP-ribosylglycohydrolase family protein n=1 Tax=Noviherbaspirillum galbum TaxID=2709383 RepID=A0A6B3SWJ9_9BURK|nr:ADP-ribosylglycohydrolase family protein [Noviherbaspirillum galbum]NEX63346.1 ADP-ribosylglycohydrolase family protein [Noviherbaspirillum galbum]